MNLQGESGMGKKVQVWIVRGKDRSSLEVLLLKTVAVRGGFWQPVTGSVEQEESNFSAAQRELREETGFCLSSDELSAIGYSFEFDSRWGGRVREEVFAAWILDAGTVKIDSREHSHFCWVDERQAFFLLHHEETKKCFQKVLKFFSDHFSIREN